MQPFSLALLEVLAQAGVSKQLTVGVNYSIPSHITQHVGVTCIEQTKIVDKNIVG